MCLGAGEDERPSNPYTRLCILLPMAEPSLQETLDRLHRKRASHEGFLKIIQRVLGVVAIGLFGLVLWLDDFIWALFLLVLLGFLGATIETVIHLSRVARKENEAIAAALEGRIHPAPERPTTQAWGEPRPEAGPDR